MMEAFIKLGMEENFFNIFKAIYEKFILKIRLNGEILKAVMLKSEERQECPILSPPFSIILEILARAIK